MLILLVLCIVFHWAHLPIVSLGWLLLYFNFLCFSTKNAIGFLSFLPVSSSFVIFRINSNGERVIGENPLVVHAGGHWGC